MMNEAKRKITPGSELDDQDYPYLLFVQERGWKYVDESQRQAAYLREILVRHNKILNEEEFVAEAGEKYADAAKAIYPKLAVWARSGIISPRELYNYARHLWCMKNPEALLCVQTGAKQWAVNSCDTEISVERAIKIVCRDWGFDEKCISIQPPAYYESTDWNYIRFRSGSQAWVMHDGEIEKVFE